MAQVTQTKDGGTTMTIEEKAKAYDEAIAKAQKELQTCGSTDCDAARQIYRFFPELKESKDEMIRKMCMRYLDREYQHCSFADDKKNIEKCIAWLEKQSKSKWSEKDENFFANICSIIDTDRNFTEFAKRRCKEWLESLKDRVQLQNMWKPSKEQIVALRWILNNIPYNKHKEEISGLLDQIKHL